MSAFENNLRNLRNRKNLKQDELAERMNVTRQTISGWETGRRQPDLDTLKRLAETLDADVQELIYGSKPVEYPMFQNKYVFRTVGSGGLVTVLLLLWLFVWPHFKVMCTNYHWGLCLSVCCYVIPSIGAFAVGSLIPSFIQLFIPVIMKKDTAMRCLIIGIAGILPLILFWLAIPPCSRWILYPAGKALILFFLPAISGVFIMLASLYETAREKGL